MSKWGTSASGNVRNGPREEASIAGTLAGKSVPRVLSRLGVSPEWQDWTSGALTGGPHLLQYRAVPYVRIRIDGLGPGQYG